MSARSRPPAQLVLRRAATVEQPQGMPVLLAAEPFARLSAMRVAAALARGLQNGAIAAPELLELPGEHAPHELRDLLERERFDARLQCSRALVIAAAELSERSLAGSPTFELATRARQAGVPAYAVAARSTLDPFDARILDLQLVLRARGERTLSAAGERLARLLLGGSRAASAGSPGTRR
jgi:hypothetical protein